MRLPGLVHYHQFTQLLKTTSYQQPATTPAQPRFPSFLISPFRALFSFADRHLIVLLVGPALVSPCHQFLIIRRPLAYLSHCSRRLLVCFSSGHRHGDGIGTSLLDMEDFLGGEEDRPTKHRHQIHHTKEVSTHEKTSKSPSSVKKPARLVTSPRLDPMAVRPTFKYGTTTTD